MIINIEESSKGRTNQHQHMLRYSVETRIIRKQAIIENLDSFTNFIKLFAQNKQFDKLFLLELTLVIEELIVNTITYGYPVETNKANIELRLTYFSDKTVKVVIIDDGIPFNILKVEKPDINLSLLERPNGGLGILFVKSKTDMISYKRKNGNNILILFKKAKEIQQTLFQYQDYSLENDWYKHHRVYKLTDEKTELIGKY